MKRLLEPRRRTVAVGALGAIVVALAAGYGYAAVTTTNNAYSGCLQNGTISNVAIGSAPSRACGRAATEINWNQTGPPGQNGTNGTNGTNGVSVTAATEPAGANCPTGGSKFTAANGVTYACNGVKGDDGANGTSVTSTALMAGDANCPEGGSSFTSSSGTTYACNGAGGSGAITGSVEADGTVTGNGGLSATVLEQGVYAVSYDGFDPTDAGIVTLSAVSSYSGAGPSMVTRIPSDDADLRSALGGTPPGIIVRSVRHDGSAAPFDIHIDLTQAPFAGIVGGSVNADGSVTNGQGGLTATVLDSGVYLLTYPGFDPSHPGVVTGSVVSSFSAAHPSTFDRIPSDDANLLAALGASSPLTGIIVRSVRSDGSAAPFDVHIDVNKTD